MHSLCISVSANSARHSVWHLWRHDWTHQLSGNLLARWSHQMASHFDALNKFRQHNVLASFWMEDSLALEITGTRFVAVRVVRQWRIWGVVIEGFCMFFRRDFQDGSTDSQPKQLGDLLTTDDARPRALSLLEDAGRFVVLSENRLLQDLMVEKKLAHYWYYWRILEAYHDIPNSQTYTSWNFGWRWHEVLWPKRSSFTGLCTQRRMALMDA